MGRDHFAQYAKSQPKEYQTFSDSLWNGFVGITHTIGLSKFFSFTPIPPAVPAPKSPTGRFAPGEIDGDQDKPHTQNPPIE
jgi:hypothetical protein